MPQKEYRATIGLEVHVELATKSKMFCGCKNAPHESEPNALTCPVCLAHPGTLPVPNEEAIAHVILFGHAVGATVATYSEFDRKHYFYPDIPKAYQISQYAFPFLTGGSLLGVSLTRVHLEEDTARSQHDKGDHSLVDFNRAGVPLMELVTEPVLHDGASAAAFARELQLVLRTLGIAHAQMERGEMRVEANISVSADDTLGTKVEVKNLNSFRSVELAIAYEIERQTQLLNSGGEVAQETMGWDEVKLRTYTQRSKETAKDYRYFPDPDLPKMDISAHKKFSGLSENMPELPESKRIKYKDIGLPISQIEQVINNEIADKYYAELYELVGNSASAKPVLTAAANYLTSDILWLLSKGETLNLSAGHFIELMTMVTEGRITSRVAKDILSEIVGTDGSPATIAAERGLERSNDIEAIKRIVKEVVAENASVAEEYRAGKAAALQFLLGQAMKKSKGAADPAMLKTLFEDSLV